MNIDLNPAQRALARSKETAPGRRIAPPWYRRAFQCDYLDIYTHRDLAEARQAVRFLAVALKLEKGQRLLDLCCGPGRHLVFLGPLGVQAVGLDLSRVLLTRAKEHWRAADEAEVQAHKSDASPTPLLIQGDMRSLPLASGAFDRVVNLFTSFGYFEREDDNFKVLCEIARILKPGERGDADPAGGPGMLAIDHINRERMLADLKPETERVLGGNRRLLEKRRWDEGGRRVTKEAVYIQPDGQTSSWWESVRVYEPDELAALLEQAGLEPLARHGDYDGAPWRPDSPRLILIARRNIAGPSSEL